MKRLDELVAQARTKGLYVHVLTPSGCAFEQVTWDAVVVPRGLFYIENVVDWANTESRLHLLQGHIDEDGSIVTIRTCDGVVVSLDTLEGGFYGDQEAIATATAERDARKRIEGASGAWRDETLEGVRRWEMGREDGSGQ